MEIRIQQWTLTNRMQPGSLNSRSLDQWLLFPHYIHSASGLDNAGNHFALLLHLFDYTCLCLASVGVADVVNKRQFTYSFTW